MKLKSVFSGNQRNLYIPLLIFAVFFVSIQSHVYGSTLAKEYQGLLLIPEKTIKPYTMINQDGEEMLFPIASGKYQLIFFGYSSCPDICPMTLHKIKQTIRQLGNSEKVEYYFVSIDAERDKPEILKSLVSYHHPKINGVTGSIHNIKGIEKEFGILTRKFQGKSAFAYKLEHSVFMYLLNPEGRLVLMYPGSVEPQQLVADLKKLTANM